MAYGFNGDRSKAPMYTKAEIDTMNLADDQALAQEVEARQIGDSALDARISNIIAQGQSTEGNTELIDIRTDFRGFTHTTASDSIKVSDALMRVDIGDILANRVWQQGGYGNIQNYSEPNENTVLQRAHLQIDTGLPRNVFLKVEIFAGYEVQIAAFDSNNQKTKYVDFTSNPFVIDVFDLKTLRLSVKRVDGSESMNITNLLEIQHVVKIHPFNNNIDLRDSIDSNSSAITNTVKALSTDEPVYMTALDFFGADAWTYGAIISATSENTGLTRIKTTDKVSVDNTKKFRVYCDDGYQVSLVTYKEDDSWVSLNSSYAQEKTNESMYNYGDAAKLRMQIKKDNNGQLFLEDLQHVHIRYWVEEQERESFLSRNSFKLLSFNLGRFAYGVSPYYMTEQEYQDHIINYRRFFAGQDADVLCLQECGEYMDADHLHQTNAVLFDPLYPNHIDAWSSTHMKSKLPFKSSSIGTTSTSRYYALAVIDVNGVDVLVICIHLSPYGTSEAIAARVQELNEILALTTGYDHVVIAGDTNFKSKSELDTLVNAGYTAGNLAWFGDYFTYSHDPNDFITNTPSSQAEYLDNVFTKGVRIDSFESVNDYQNLTSDHIAVKATLTVV